MKPIISKMIQRIGFFILFIPAALSISAQNLNLVWSEEFEGSTIDNKTWQFETGPTNDNVHFYTDRAANAKILDGKLQIIALKETYQGFEYTSAHVRTEHSWSFRYGRIEASIKLPGTKGFVPAFWMLPEESHYGWWPNSGEIDIMEYPTSEWTKIYGTVHTEEFNLFEGPLPPQGGTIDITDVTDNFHLYAIEWTPEKIDFFVDDQKYYSFLNNNGTSSTWPFNQPFYIILNLAVGGGWVGTPDQSTVFPAVMEIDFVRVYQLPENLTINGTDYVTYNSENQSYRIGEIEGASYQWTVPGGARITSGQGTSEITVDWGLFGGDVEVLITTDQGSYLKEFPVRVSSDLLKNSSFETGVKYWNSRLGYPVAAEIMLVNNEAYGGSQSVSSTVEQPPANPWDVQLSQGDIELQAGTHYYGSFTAKAGLTTNEITAAVVNASSFALAAQKTVTPGENWNLYEFDFTPSQSFTALFNVDMGANAGSYYLDNFKLTTPELTGMNQVQNPDFFDGDSIWTLTTLSGATAAGSVTDGEFAVAIGNPGSHAWDVHLGQAGLRLEQGFEYTFSFDAYTDAPMQITPIVGKNSEPWTVYSNGNPVTLSTGRQTYSLTFPMNQPTDMEARLGFDIGGIAGNLYFDNILLRKGDEISTSSSSPELSAEPSFSIRNFPNPIDNQTSFYFTLQKPSLVTLQIYNLKGQDVATLVNGARLQGDHITKWNRGKLPAGVYFYRFQVGRESVSGKLVLLK
jgi:beta-glucanase (GH16 family)